MQDTGVHVPNLVVGMMAEDASPQIFFVAMTLTLS